MIDISSMPLDPGCYLYKDSKGDVIYVGKAKNLRKRVSSYFKGRIDNPKTQAMVSEIVSMDYFVTSNEIEALVLESNLIKRYRPRFNIDLKDSHRYAYINVTDEDYPRLVVAREKNGNGKYYGPFVNAAVRSNIIKALRKAFGIRICKRMRKKPCLRYHIGICSAPCVGGISQEDYLNNIRSAETFLEGRVLELINDLKKEMKDQSRAKNYEKAIILRDQIGSLSVLMEKQQVEVNKKYNEDIINYIIDDDKVCLIVFNVYKGALDNKAEFKFDNMEGFLDEFIIQYYSDNEIPREIILPKAPLDDSISSYLEDKRGSKVKITIPKRGRKLELLELVRRNIETRYLESRKMLIDLRDVLKLKRLPDWIECIDISHISGSHTVGSMVCFRDGHPDKSSYRRFKIRAVDGIDDYAAVSEVVRRRYSRLKDEGIGMPSLVVIDGGKGQLMAAHAELERLDLSIPIISLAKRNEEVYVHGLRTPINIKEGSMALKLLVQLRDESHRFAINYHRLLRSKGMLKDV